MSTATSRQAKQRASAQKFAHRAVAYKLVTDRWEANGNRCEGCGNRVDIIERHHTVGRGCHMDDQYASRAEMIVALCCLRSYGMERPGCHERITNEEDPALRDRMRLLALTRLCAAEHAPLSLLASGDPMGGARALEDWLKERGRSEDLEV